MQKQILLLLLLLGLVLPQKAPSAAAAAAAVQLLVVLGLLVLQDIISIALAAWQSWQLTWTHHFCCQHTAKAKNLALQRADVAVCGSVLLHLSGHLAAKGLCWLVVVLVAALTNLTSLLLSQLAAKGRPLVPTCSFC